MGHRQMSGISVIIPTCNSGECFRKNLSTLRDFVSQKALPLEVIVVDAGSSDATLEIAEELADKVLFAPGVSRGRARNIGASAASNHTLVFLDSDCRITESWADFIVRRGEVNRNVVSGPVALCEPQNKTGEAIRDLLSDPILTLKSSTFLEKKSRDETLKELPASNLLVSKEAFEETGGFPDLNFNEDTLFSKAFIEHGGKLVYVPEFRCVHYKQFASLGGFSKYFFTYGEGYGKTAKCSGLFRRYALASLLFLLYIAASGMSIALNVVEPLQYLTFIVLCILVLSLYSVVRNRKLLSAATPLLFFILVASYAGGFFFGIFHTRN